MTAVLFAFICIAALAAFFISQARARRVVAGDVAMLHSRPSYHGAYSLLWVLMAGFGLLIVMTAAPGAIVDSTLMGRIAAALPGEPGIAHELVLSDARAIAAGGVASKIDDLRMAIATDYSRLAGIWGWARIVLVMGGVMVAALCTGRMVSAERRARNRTEKIVQLLLAAMATIAILTPVGIVLSLFFEALNFFGKSGWRID